MPVSLVQFRLSTNSFGVGEPQLRRMMVSGLDDCADMMMMLLLLLRNKRGKRMRKGRVRVFMMREGMEDREEWSMGVLFRTWRRGWWWKTRKEDFEVFAQNGIDVDLGMGVNFFGSVLDCC